jgi:hypothetical protein
MQRYLREETVMGWASGSGLLIDCWRKVREDLPPEKRVKVLKALMDSFSNEDCDTLDEVVCKEWPESKEAYDLWENETFGEEPGS